MFYKFNASSFDEGLRWWVGELPSKINDHLVFVVFN